MALRGKVARRFSLLVTASQVIFFVIASAASAAIKFDPVAAAGKLPNALFEAIVWTKGSAWFLVPAATVLLGCLDAQPL